MATAGPALKRPYRMAARAEAAAETRKRILASAWRLFSDRPYEDVRVADVARDAGVTAQTVHSGFGTKDALFVAAWSSAVAPEGQRRLEARVGDVEGAVRILYDSYEAGGDAVLRLLAEEDRIPAVRQMTDSGRRWHRRWVERTFAPLLDGHSGARRQRRLAALVVATDLSTWKLLRRDMGLSRSTVERVVTEMVTAMKGPD
jgi:AcrR family transcriptional regulator